MSFVVINMNSWELVQSTKQKKYDLLNQINDDPFTCYYSEGGGCDYCTHPDNCIFSTKRISFEQEYYALKREYDDVCEYYDTGMGTVGYDKKELMKQKIRLKKQLQELKK